VGGGSQAAQEQRVAGLERVRGVSARGGADECVATASERCEVRLLRSQPHTTYSMHACRFVGVTRHPNVCIVLALVPYGSLYDYVRSDAAVDGSSMMRVIRGIASGLTHLHANGVVHRDLAARNVLLGDDWTAQINDFGMSRALVAVAEHGHTERDTGCVCVRV
jgi:serine/threonine protein kinase